MSNKSEIKIPVFLSDDEEERCGLKNTYYLLDFTQSRTGNGSAACLGVFGENLYVFRRSDFLPDEREAIERGETHPFTYKPRRKTGFEKRLPLRHLFLTKEWNEEKSEEIEELHEKIDDLVHQNIKLKDELKRVKNEAKAKSKKKGKVKK